MMFHSRPFPVGFLFNLRSPLFSLDFPLLTMEFSTSDTTTKIGRKSTENFRRRRPLRNITNGIAYSLRSGYKRPKPNPAPSVLAETSPQFSAVGSSNGSVGGGDTEEDEDSQTLRPESNVPSVKGCSGPDLGLHVITYPKSTSSGDYRKEDRRRNKKNKEVITLGGTSCPPAVRIRRLGALWSNSKVEHEANDLPETFSVPILKPKKRKKYKMSATSPELEEDIKKQRDYFADVDAFELIEEVVSEREMD